jgi:hypothetical protein
MVMTAEMTATDQQLTPTAPSAERFSVSELLPPGREIGGFPFYGYLGWVRMVRSSFWDFAWMGIGFWVSSIYR